MISSAADACLVDGVPADQAVAARKSGGQRDVLGHAHPFHQRQVLVDEGDRQILDLWVDRAVGQQNASGIGAMHAGQNLDQRRFAGAVAAQQRMDLALADVEIDASTATVPPKVLTMPRMLMMEGCASGIDVSCVRGC